MATASKTNWTVDLSGLEQMLAQAVRITEQRMTAIQKRVETAGKHMGDTLTASGQAIAQATQGTFRTVQRETDMQLNVPYAKELIALKANGALAAAQIGMGKRQQASAGVLSGIDTEYAQSKSALKIQFPEGANGQGGEAYLSQLKTIENRHLDFTQQVQANYAEMSQAQGNWVNGATSAWQDYLDSSGNVAAKSREVFTKAFEGMSDAVTMFVTTGKFSFSDFATSVLKDMAQLAAQTAASKGLGFLFSMASSAVGAMFNSPSTPPVSGASLPGFEFDFNPALSTSGLTAYKFANGGAFTNSVATGPTLAPMALFGEAGPEAIMPLSRGADGALGIRALSGSGGSSSSNQVVIQQTINVADGQGNTAGGETASQDIAKAYAGSAKQGAAEQIARDLKPGGQIWSAIHGR